MPIPELPPIPKDKNGEPLAWQSPNGDGWVDAWNGWYVNEFQVRDCVKYWSSHEDERVLEHGDEIISEAEFDDRVNAGPGPIFDQDERVMVMGGEAGWKVELWAARGGDSITLKDSFATMDEAENWADSVRAILINWDEWS